MVTEAEFRTQMVSSMERLLGEGETEGDNKGPFIKEIFTGAHPQYEAVYDYGGAAWCYALPSKILSENYPGVMEHGAMSKQGVNTFKSAGAYHTTLDEDTLKPGNFIFMPRTDGTEGMHTEIIVSFDGKTLKTIAGNIDPDGDGVDTVAYKEYPLNDIRSFAYGVGDIVELGSERGVNITGREHSDASAKIDVPTLMQTAQASPGDLGDMPSPNLPRQDSQDRQRPATVLIS